MAYFTKINDFNTFLFKRDNGIYYYYFYKNGKKVWRSTGQKTKAKAIEVMEKRVALFKSIDAEPITEITFGKFAKDLCNLQFVSTIFINKAVVCILWITEESLTA